MGTPFRSCNGSFIIKKNRTLNNSILNVRHSTDTNPGSVRIIVIHLIVNKNMIVNIETITINHGRAL